MKQRIRDFLHERAIRRQMKLCNELNAVGTLADRRREIAKLTNMMLARSPGQVARMEAAQFKRLDPHAQAIFLRSKAGEVDR